MAKPLALFLLSALFLAGRSDAAAGGGTRDGSEQWGYVQVRPGAHMFWWLYRSPRRVENGTAPWPTVLWLQGGPGASGVGYGNFMEIGPLDADLKPRASTWLQKADLLFVDTPVGTGYSFVDGADERLFVRTDEEAARDLTTLLATLYSGSAQPQRSPLYIVAESYGGKFAVTTALSLLGAIKKGLLNLNLGGVALGDSWISPEDYVLSWGPLLYDLSRLDETGADLSNSLAERIKDQLSKGDYKGAESSWEDLEELIASRSNSVNFYNFLEDSSASDAAVTETALQQRSLSSSRKNGGGYMSYLNSKASREGGLSGLMDTVIRDKLRIIPKNLTWGEQSGQVFDALKGDFMRPRIREVDELLSLGVNVTVYSGQLDLICSTKGTENWVHKLKWDGMTNFTRLDRQPLYCDGKEPEGTKGFVRSYRNLHFYWVLEAGHMVPSDNPCLALKMLGDIARSPAQ